MFKLWLLIIVLLALSLSVTVVIMIINAMHKPTMNAAKTDPEVLAVLTSAQRRAWLSIGGTVALLLIMMSINALMPSTLGLPIALAPLFAAAGAILVQAFPGQRSFRASENTVRSASLEARSAWTHVSKPALWAPIVCALALTGFLIFSGLTANADDFGLSRALEIEVGLMSTRTSPYPGWYYGVPLLIATAILLGVTVLAHARLSKIAAFPRADLSSIDNTWRRGLARIVSAISVTGMLLALSGVTLAAGRSISVIARSLIDDGHPVPTWLQSGIAISAVGGVCLLGALVIMLMATRWATLLKEQALSIAPLESVEQPPTTNPYV